MFSTMRAPTPRSRWLQLGRVLAVLLVHLLDEPGVELGLIPAEEHWTAADDADTDTAGDAPAVGEDGAPRPTAVTLGRRVVRTATLELESADPNRLVQELTSAVSAAGGFVATSDLRRDEQGVVRGTVTVRVPSEELDATLDDLEELADNAPVRRIDERDVTVESADVEAQLDNLTAYETELRALLADVRETTTRPEDLLTVFERIRQVRAEIDQLQGRLAVLSDQVSLATITVTITPTSTAVPVTDPTWEPASTAREALTAAARALSGIADAAIWIALAVLPVVRCSRCRSGSPRDLAAAPTRRRHPARRSSRPTCGGADGAAALDAGSLTARPEKGRRAGAAAGGAGAGRAGRRRVRRVVVAHRVRPAHRRGPGGGRPRGHARRLPRGLAGRRRRRDGRAGPRPAGGLRRRPRAARRRPRGRAALGRRR
jgi:SepF-like predicted cell division protein (DUF552 family)